jgi:phosphopantetheinyl transferase
MAITRIKYLSPHSLIGVWQLDEPESFFKEHLQEICKDEEQMAFISHARRRTEWLAGRYLIRELAFRIGYDFDGIYTDEHGKPHLFESTGHISISHANPYVVGMLNTEEPCGVDIEQIRPKLRKLAPKFLSASELSMASDQLNNFGILWGAKEALYKLHGRKQLIFKDNLEITDINFTHNQGDFKGLIKEHNNIQEVKMHYRQNNSHILVFTCSSDI